MPNTYACKLVFPIQMFQYFREGLHFGAFHLSGTYKTIEFIHVLVM